VTAVYDAWCSLKEIHAPLIARVAARYGITTERLLQSSLLCVALHDVGKLTRNFADMMRADEAEYEAAIRRNYRHEVAPLWLITQAARAMNTRQGLFPGEGLLETLAVAGHHKYLAEGYLIDEMKFRGKSLVWDHGTLKDIEAAVELARLMFREQGWRFPKFNVTPGDLEYWLTQAPNAADIPPFDWLSKSVGDLAILVENTKADFRDLFVLLKGLLMTADWMASGAKGEVEALDARHGVVHGVRPDLVEGHLRERHEQRVKARPELRLGPFEGYKDFQANCGAATGHVVAIAPTGSGKTEASWLWALGQIERGHARKVLVLLPTMVTSNSIHKRLCAFFEPKGHRVGLVHSTADLIRSNSPDIDEADRADVRVDLSETHLFLPVTVGTVDQLLVPLFHAGRWALKSLAAASSAVIIDEVHAYDPHTLGLITLMIRQLAPLGTRFMVMSATMPKSLRDAIEAELKSEAPDSPGVTIVEDSELLNSARNTWETRDIPLTRWLLPEDKNGNRVPSPEFLELWGSRNDRGELFKILIVVNTVKRCQDLAKSLREFGFDLICYHSKFILDHRRDKERRIEDNPPRLLIATQVVEVSLDIDYDLLLTECAPIDALVQRAGRVNRSRRKVPGRVIIFRHEKESETVYAYPRGVLESTWERCRALDRPPTEQALIDLVEEVYAGENPTASDGYISIQSATLGAQKKQSGVLDSPRPHEEDAILKTRKDDYPQVSVIPDCFSDQVNGCVPKQRRRYELKIPVWYARKHKVRTDDIPLCPMNYDPEFGAKLLASKEHPEPGYEIY
jgi:CRISPR-associated endonuclease/helicase Cas3